MPYADIIAVIISVFMVLLSTLVSYEAMAIIWRFVEKRLIKVRRFTVFLLVLCLFSIHTLIIWSYGLVYWVMVEKFEIGSLGGLTDNDFLTYVYFSAASYSSLGLGDVYPQGALRMIAGVEVLNGLMLIGWSVSLTYIAMERLWNYHNGNSFLRYKVKNNVKYKDSKEEK